MKLQLNKQVVISFGLAMSIFLVIGYCFFQSISDSETTADSRRTAFRTQVKLEQFLSHLKDTETGQRGYLLTLDESYLKPYLDATAQVQDDMAEVNIILAGNEIQKKRFDEIRTLTQKKLDELALTIKATKDHRLDEALRLVKADVGKNYMDAIRNLISQMVETEAISVDRTDAKLQEGFENTSNISLVGFIIALALLMFGAYQLNSQMDARQKVNLTLVAEISERTRAELEVKRLNHDLEKQLVAINATNKELEAFAYSVSHDLRAPLRSIDGFSKILLERAREKLDEEERRYLKNVCENSQRMGELIDDLLNLSRLTRSDMRHETVNLSNMATTILNKLQAEAPERQVTLQIQENLTVDGDSNLLRVMMENLLENAWKYTGKLETACIEFGSRVEGERTVYFVKDNGAGFNMKYSEKLFGVFQRLHRMEDFPGTGIGLATVQRVIHRHGGMVWAESKINEGATFYFTL